MQKRLTLIAAAVLLAVIGLLPVLTMVTSTFYAGGRLSLNAYQELLGSGKLHVTLMARVGIPLSSGGR